MLPLESGLAVLVPGAEALVGSFPSPSAAAGMPAHITLLYPFKPPDEIGDAAIEKLNQCFAGFRAFDFTLATIRRFPGGVLYLAPEPDESFPTAHHGGLGLLPGDATLWRQVFEHNASPNRCSTDRRAGRPGRLRVHASLSGTVGYSHHRTRNRVDGYAGRDLAGSHYLRIKLMRRPR